VSLFIPIDDYMTPQDQEFLPLLTNRRRQIRVNLTATARRGSSDENSLTNLARARDYWRDLLRHRGPQRFLPRHRHHLRCDPGLRGELH